VDFDALVDLGISKPARYLGNELGVLPRDWGADWGSAGVRWALTYPEVYEVGASNSGHIILYSILNAVPGQLCDRSYLPGPDLAQRLRQRSVPLFAVESRRPLAAFDILGFSLSYELGGTNILEMLELAGIPLRAAERGDLPLAHPEAPPLIFAGGPTATSNPEPFAAFFDFIALGDGEELLPEIGLVVAEARAAGLSRRQLLRDLAQVPGVYVPCLYAPGADGVTIEPLESGLPARIQRRTSTPMPHYAMGLVPHIETVHDRLTVEIRRGCTRGCRLHPVRRDRGGGRARRAGAGGLAGVRHRARHSRHGRGGRRRRGAGPGRTTCRHGPHRRRTLISPGAAAKVPRLYGVRRPG
jgi:hypothetical protein